MIKIYFIRVTVCVHMSDLKQGKEALDSNPSGNTETDFQE